MPVDRPMARDCGDPPQRAEQVSLTSEEFREVIGHFASGVTIITSAVDGKTVGTTASAVSSLSLEPPMLLICMNASSRTGEVIHQVKRFGVNILNDSQADLAVQFARKGDDKFDGVEIVQGPGGTPLLGSALATLECKVTDQVRAGTHVVFIARVEHASVELGVPLAYFRGQFGRLQLAAESQLIEDLRRLILNRELPIEAPLTVEEVADLTGFPADPLRFALVHLSFEGLVGSGPDGSFVVRALSPEAVEDTLRARELIEQGAVAAAVDSASDDDIARIQHLAERTDPAVHRGVVSSWVRAYVEFHDGLVGLAGSKAVVEAYHRLNTPPMVLSLASERAAGRQGRESAVRAHADHLDVVEAIRRGDGPRARTVIERHYEDSVAFAREGDS